ncbi:MAG TPA: hypothetical protein VK457_18770 [Chloroflexota bacterium]|nr:hypothetical protein [Chloroflexota bacterium]
MEDTVKQSLHIDPYTLPAEAQGWRGLSVPGSHKRKWYTILHNDQVLVTALLLIPGEASIRHSHESGELSIHFDGTLRPIATWNPPGVLHGPPPPIMKPEQAESSASSLGTLGDAEQPVMRAILEEVLHLREQVQVLEQLVAELRRPAPGPRVIVDVIFPPFKTTIDDPAYPEKKTVIGQWYD